MVKSISRKSKKLKKMGEKIERVTVIRKMKMFGAIVYEGHA